jgi:oligopeptide transport system substrate-binding protein
MSFRWLKPTAVAAVLFAVGLSAANAQVVYNRGNDTDPETLDPHKTSTVSETHILRDLFEGLVINAANGELVPGVAETWEVSADGLTYTFHLRSNARWSNGDPVTADDFVYSYRRILDPATAARYANVLYPILNAEAVNNGTMPVDAVGVAAPDPLTLVVTLASPTPYFLQLLTHQTSFPVLRSNVEQFGDAFVQAGNLVSNGAYVLQSNTPNDRIVLVKNPYFHDAANVQIDQVNFYPMQDRAACMRRFEAGEIQSCSDVPVEQMDYIVATFGDQFRTAPYLGTYYYSFDLREPGLENPNVRHALSMVIDRQFLAEDIWANTMVPAFSLVPPGTNNYGTPAFLPFMDRPILDNEDEARRLLAEAGFGPNNPLRVTIRHNIGQNHANTATAIADMWANIGVETTIEAYEGAAYYPYLQDGGRYSIARAGWIADYNDPQNFLFLLEPDNPAFNYAHWINMEYDGLMTQAAQTVDLTERAGILAQAEALLMADEPIIVLLHYGSKNLVSRRLHGWEDNPQDFHATRWMTLDP